ncbi:hypothetical protein DH2020_017908 [Rehmannia glutinosa]|uniref:Origin recognition complex subunit 3 n=1 Tax=Rehmannia glutinosa TaxID=99300 RepID=A0ABR0WJD0_REHGL
MYSVVIFEKISNIEMGPTGPSPSNQESRPKCCIIATSRTIISLLRISVYELVWSGLCSLVVDVFHNGNISLDDDLQQEVSDAAFTRVKWDLSLILVMVHYDLAVQSSWSTSAEISRPFLMSKKMDLSDVLSTLAPLIKLVESQNWHVLDVGSCEYSTKCCRLGLLNCLGRPGASRQIFTALLFTTISFFEANNYEKPLVIIIEDVERCCGSVLNDFIIMLREWVIKVPIILILGVATTVDALKNILSSNTYLDLSVCEFNLGTPAERMDAVIEAVLLKNCETFSIGKHVSTFLRNYFIRHDGTLTLFVRALKIAMVQHIHAEPLSFNLRKLVDEEGAKARLTYLFFAFEISLFVIETVRKRVLDLPSLQRCCQPSADYADMVSGLFQLKRLRKLWSSTVMCLYEVGKYRKITLLDLYCETLEPEPRNSSASDYTRLAKDNTISSHDHHLVGCSRSEGYIVWAFQKVRDLPPMELCKLLNRWEMLTRGIPEIHEKVKELQSLTTCEENRPKREPTESSRRPTARNRINEKTDKPTVNEKVATFLQCIVRQYIQPIESIPFNEIVFFNNVDKLQTALVGDPRRRIQTDLLESNKFLKCSCCSKNGGAPVPSMHNTSIMYSLAQEHGDLINLHEWFHSFKAIVSQPTLPVKKRLRMSPAPKKRKESNEPQNKSDATIQAEFCRAVMELQITGLLRMPSKRRPDYVQRVAFGL